jgi:hypothetical protein
MTGERFLDYPQPKFRVPVMVLEGDALGHLIDYARKWKSENDRIRDSRIANRGRK